MTRKILFACLLSAGFGWTAVQERPFPVGEELVYSISFNGVPVAWSRAVTEMDEVEGQPVLALRITINTYPFFDRIFKVNDFYETLVDPDTLLPIRYTQNLNQRRYRCHEVTSFDFETLTAHYVHQTNGREKTYEIREGMRDILSFLYFMRAEELAEDRELIYPVMSDEKIYDLQITTLGTTSMKLSGYDRRIPALEARPEAMFDGLFVRKGKATVWISRDPRRLLLQARLSVPFGRISVVLQEVRGPGDDFWIQEKQENHDGA